MAHPQRPDPPPRVVVVPDLDGDVEAVLDRFEELLLSFAGLEEQPDELAPDDLPLPAVLADRGALDPLGHVSTRVRRALGGAGRLLGPDGRYEHTPLRFVKLDAIAVDVLGAAVAELGRSLLPGGHELVGAVVADHARANRVTGARCESEPQALMADLARLHGLLDLGGDDDQVLLASAPSATGGADVVLTVDQEAAYQRTVDRVMAMWHLNHPLDRFLY